MTLPRPKILAVSFPPSDDELLTFLREEAAKRQVSISRVVREMLYKARGGKK